MWQNGGNWQIQLHEAIKLQNITSVCLGIFSSNFFKKPFGKLKKTVLAIRNVKQQVYGRDPTEQVCNIESYGGWIQNAPGGAHLIILYRSMSNKFLPACVFNRRTSFHLPFAELLVEWLRLHFACNKNRETSWKHRSKRACIFHIRYYTHSQKVYRDGDKRVGVSGKAGLRDTPRRTRSVQRKAVLPHLQGEFMTNDRARTHKYETMSRWRCHLNMNKIILALYFI